jgi:hypothetical protein
MSDDPKAPKRPASSDAENQECNRWRGSRFQGFQFARAAAFTKVIPNRPIMAQPLAPTSPLLCKSDAYRHPIFALTAIGESVARDGPPPFGFAYPTRIYARDCALFPRPLRREQPNQPLHCRYLFVYELNKQQEGVIRMSEKSAVQRIKELDDERAKIFGEAKEEALQKATQAVADLNALGLNYKLIAGDAKAEDKLLKKATPKSR